MMVVLNQSSAVTANSAVPPLPHKLMRIDPCGAAHRHAVFISIWLLFVTFVFFLFIFFWWWSHTVHDIQTMIKKLFTSSGKLLNHISYHDNRFGRIIQFSNVIFPLLIRSPRSIQSILIQFIPPINWMKWR